MFGDAVGAKGTAPLGRALYLPEERSVDAERRRAAKVPDDVTSRPSPSWGSSWSSAAGWAVPPAPVLGDCAYGENTDLAAP